MCNEGEKQNGTLYRKKPVVVAAMQWDGKQRDIYDFLTGTKNEDMRLEGDTFRVALENGPCTLGSLYIKTLESEMKANLGDWIIKGVNGEFYPCKQDIFEKTYEPVCCTAESKEPAAADMHNDALIEYTLDEGKRVSVTIRLDNLHRDVAPDVTEKIVASELEAVLRQAGISLCVTLPLEPGKGAMRTAEEILLGLENAGGDYCNFCPQCDGESVCTSLMACRDLAIPGIAAVIERNRTPESGTSVVRWMKYGDCRPEPGRHILRWIRGSAYAWLPDWCIPPDLWRADDYWAYLPEPPEGAQCREI